MNYKRPGCCSLCDALCFEVRARWSEGEARAGEPKRFGPPLDGVTRITFLLVNGNRTDMTVCADCAKSVGPQHYATLWRKNLAGWLREQNGNPEKFKDEFSNGLLCELGRKEWKELARGSQS
jgi:hypothetical protein